MVAEIFYTLFMYLLNLSLPIINNHCCKNRFSAELNINPFRIAALHVQFIEASVHGQVPYYKVVQI
jgi:hypothetical protein